jgi:Reverse transcriptase (RNA-dependent DNA polymerase).
VHVDDLLFFGNSDKELEKLKKRLSGTFKMTDIGNVSKYFGINVKQNLDQGKTEIDQTNHLKRLRDIYGMVNCKTMSLPVEKILILVNLNERNLKVKKLSLNVGS